MQMHVIQIWDRLHATLNIFIHLADAFMQNKIEKARSNQIRSLEQLGLEGLAYRDNMLLTLGFKLMPSWS